MRNRLRFIPLFLIVLLSIVMLPVSQALSSYEDVTPRYEKAIQYVVEKGIQGKSPQYFGVHDTITRGDAAVYIAKVLGVWDEEASPSPFHDIPESRRDVHIAVNTLYELNIVNGKTEDQFGYADDMTRGELALILSQEAAFHLTGDRTTLSFQDVGSRYIEAVAGLVAAGATSGVTEDQFGTVLPMKRGDFAQMLYRLSDEYVAPPPVEEKIERIELTRTAPLVSEVGALKYTVLHLNRGETLSVLRETPNAYEVPVANGTAFVAKGAAKRVNGSFIPAVKGAREFVTFRQVPLYDRPHGKVIGQIAKDMRLAYIEILPQHYRLNVGGQDVFVLRQQVEQDRGVPALMYHHMLENVKQTSQSNNRMVIDVRHFDDQMNYLSEQHWTTLQLEDFLKWKHQQLNLPRKSVLITFDDGILSTIRYAYPTLKKHQFYATSFVITNRIGSRAPAWNPNGLQSIGSLEIQNTKDVYNYQSHTHGSHTFYPGTARGLLVMRPYAENMKDLALSRQRLAQEYDGDEERNVALAYPFGQYNDSVIEAVRNSKFAIAFTTRAGNVKLADAPYTLHRQGVYPNDTLHTFKRKLEGEIIQ